MRFAHSLARYGLIPGAVAMGATARSAVRKTVVRKTMVRSILVDAAPHTQVIGLIWI